MALNPHSNVIVPFLAAGEREFEFNVGMRTHGNESLAARASSATFGYGYAFTNFFKSEIKFGFNQGREFQDIEQVGIKVDTIAWENHYLFTDRGEYFVDPGIFWEIEHRLDQPYGNEIVIGALFRKDIKMLELNINPYVEQVFDRKTSSPAQVGYQWQGKYRFFQTPSQSTLSIGVQGFGGLGAWNNWSAGEDQIHRLGPSLFYRWRLGSGRKSWNGSVAYLFDVTKINWGSGTDVNSGSDILRSRAQTFRLQIEYAF